MSIPPVQGASFNPIPSDESILQQLKDLLKEYKEDMKAYQDDPSKANEDALKKIAGRLSTFVDNNKAAIEKACSDNGWPANGVGGYIQELTGLINSAKLIISEPHPKYGEMIMLNEDAGSLIDMMSEKR